MSADREKLKQFIKHVIKKSRRSELAEDIKKEIRYDTGELKTALTELNEKLDELIRIKTAHDKRVLELEQKIKQKVSDNYIEIMRIEQHLKDLEEHFETIKKKGHDRTTLKKIKGKIESLRKKAKEKKTEIAMAQFTSRQVPGTRVIMQLPKPLKPMIKHEMHFSPKNTLPEPPAPPASPIAPPFIKKEKSKSRFWNFIRGLILNANL